MKTVGINNLTGVGRRVPGPSPSEWVRTHPWASGGELQALAAFPRSWQQAQASSRSTWHIRVLGLGCHAEGRTEELPACVSPSPWVLGQPPSTARDRLLGRHKARRNAPAGEMARIGFCPRRSRKHFVPSEPPIRPYCGAAPGPR